MDLKIFFNPIDADEFSDINSLSAFYKSISVYGEKMPDYQDVDIALIGLEENRGTDSDPGVQYAASEIRKKLFNLKKGYGTYKVIDLGNLRNGVTLEETYSRIREVCQILIESNVLPVLFGGSHDLDYGQYQAYDGLDKLISLINVDAFLDMEDGLTDVANKEHIHKILLHDPNYLFNYSHLAFQSYLIDSGSINTLEKLYFEAYRLGHIRSNINDMEPVIRNADMMSFDITSIKSSDAPGNSNAQPFGLTGEEACQICWYAGLNEKLSSIGFYEYNPEMDDQAKKTASVIATMIWYFIEGFYHRKNEQDFKANDYLKYVVSMPSDPETLIFYKSKLSEKWWMEVPHPRSGDPYQRNCIVPCSYTDYESATKGELPERYINTHSKLT
ncbi:MAG: formimidoylglutamase [Bacteroidota bacterium]